MSVKPISWTLALPWTPRGFSEPVWCSQRESWFPYRPAWLPQSPLSLGSATIPALLPLWASSSTGRTPALADPMGSAATARPEGGCSSYISPSLPAGCHHGGAGSEVSGPQPHRVLHHGSWRWGETADGPGWSLKANVSLALLFGLSTKLSSALSLLCWVTADSSGSCMVGTEGTLWSTGETWPSTRAECCPAAQNGT